MSCEACEALETEERPYAQCDACKLNFQRVTHGVMERTMAWWLQFVPADYACFRYNVEGDRGTLLRVEPPARQSVTGADYVRHHEGHEVCLLNTTSGQIYAFKRATQWPTTMLVAVP